MKPVLVKTVPVGPGQSESSCRGTSRQWTPVEPVPLGLVLSGTSWSGTTSSLPAYHHSSRANKVVAVMQLSRAPPSRNMLLSTEGTDS